MRLRDRGIWCEIGDAHPSEQVFIRNTNRNRRLEITKGLDALISKVIDEQRIKMKVSEAKRLQPGDTVFFFVRTERTKATVVKVVVESLQKIWIDLEWHDASGSVFSVRRIHTAAYLTKETLARIAARISSHPQPDCTPIVLAENEIPGEILRCAIRIENWMKENNYLHWKLMGIQSRED